MGVRKASVSDSQCLCEHCHRYSYPEQVAGNGGRCPFCGRALADDGWARPVNMVGGRSVLGYEALAKLAAMQRDAERRAAEAMGEVDSGNKDVLGEEDLSSKKRIYGSDGMENRDPPDFAPPPEDEALLNEIREDDINDRIADVWETDDEDTDEFGNPIVHKKEEPAAKAKAEGGDGDGGGSGSGSGTGGIAAGPPDDDDPEFDVPDPEDPFGEDVPEGAFEGMDERPGGDYDPDDEDPGDDLPDAVSTAAYDPAGTGVPQEVPEESRRLAMEARQAKQGVPTRSELKVLRGLYPSSMLKGFDRGPRPNFLSGPEDPRERHGPEGVPQHEGILKYLDRTRIDYPQDYEMAKRFV